MKALTALTLFGLIAVFAGCSSETKEVSLQFKYQDGMTLTYEQNSKGSIEVFENDSLVKAYLDHKWADVTQSVNRQLDDSTYEIDESVTWYFLKPNKADSLLNDTIVDTRSMTLRVTVNGKIVDFTVDDKLASRYDYFKNFYEQGMPVFPDKPVTTGYTWTQSAKVVLPDEVMNASTTYEVASLVRESGYDCAVVKYDGNLLIPIDDEWEGKKRNGLDKVKVTGKIYFAYKEGIVVKQNENWILSRDMTITADGSTNAISVASDFNTDFVLTDKSM